MPRPISLALKIIAGIVATVVLGIACFFGWVTWNTHGYFQRYVDKAQAAGYIEHQHEVRDGVSLNYAEHANDKTPLLLIPGQGSIWQDYAPSLPALAEHYHVVVVDVHGHGKSNWNREDYTAVRIAEDLTSLGRHIFKSKFVVAGHSSGGLIAAQMAAEFPQDVQALVLEDAPFFATETDRVPSTFAGQDNKLLKEFLEQTEEKDYVAYVLPRSYIGRMFGDAWKPLAQQIVQQRHQNPDALPEIPWLGITINRIWESQSHPYDKWWSHAFFISRSWHEGFEQEDVLRRVKVPTLFMKASTNYSDEGILLAALTDREVEHVKELVSDIRVVRVESGHDIHFEKPEWYVQQLQQFV
ncbi:alpha/beta fold hydrolase [Corynebacterium freiburgense]|uniref:alpha/beta fold hydrolase n=1 Tax=Corynebacterium freiburgense TaxID=556548 RepID=UPI0004035953|nr:alpha/beta hydrolase [Corynebacterium freiburgense]WJZ01594.1 Haloacetate dehalogenase H-1 [Corynebacterium freiburgense]